MSNRSPDSSYSQLTTALDFWGAQWTKTLHTSMPGLIVEYDSASKRATVQPALRVVMTDETERNRPPIVNVPILHPSGGGYIVHIPLVKGDPVMLVFSERGISRFKRAYKVSAPDDTQILSMRDAVGLPGFGARQVTQVDDGALCAQTDNGAQYISLKKDGNIKVLSTAKITLTAPDIELNASSGFVVNSPSVDFNS